MKKTLTAAFTLILVFTSLSTAQTLREKIGQMIMVGFYNDSELYDTLKTDLSERNLGGVVLFASNIENPEQIKQLTAEIKAMAKTPVLISTDQEGGLVARLDERNGWQETYSAYKLGVEFHSVDSTRKQAALMAGWLKESGINMNLAPVVDLNVNPLSPAIGRHKRSFSSNGDEVFLHSYTFIEEFNKENIITALKHYPGHGSAMDDSHLGFTDVTNTWSEEELFPYMELVAADYTDFVMTAHIFNSNIDPEYPASISHASIDSLLRDEVGFDGPVISDELFMQAISDNYGFEEAVVLAINAGTDVLLYSVNIYEEESLVKRVIDLVEDKVSEGIIEESRIDEAYTRIMNIKQKYGIVTGMDEPGSGIIPADFALGNYPNPFNPSTRIVLTLPAAADTKIDIYSMTGERVFTANKGKLSSGKHEITFNAGHLASGVYFVSANMGGKIVNHKIVLMK